MTRIVLTAEQMKGLSEQSGPVELASPEGDALGTVKVLTPEERLAARRYRQEAGKNGPGVPAARVQSFLQKLHELKAQDGLDDASVQEMLRRTKAGEAL